MSKYISILIYSVLSLLFFSVDAKEITNADDLNNCNISEIEVNKKNDDTSSTFREWFYTHKKTIICIAGILLIGYTIYLHTNGSLDGIYEYVFTRNISKVEDLVLYNIDGHHSFKTINSATKYWKKLLHLNVTDALSCAQVIYDYATQFSDLPELEKNKVFIQEHVFINFVCWIKESIESGMPKCAINSQTIVAQIHIFLEEQGSEIFRNYINK